MQEHRSSSAPRVVRIQTLLVRFERVGVLTAPQCSRFRVEVYRGIRVHRTKNVCRTPNGVKLRRESTRKGGISSRLCAVEV